MYPQTLKYCPNTLKKNFCGHCPRYRRLRVENGAFQRRVASHDGALELLLAAGFVEEEEEEGTQAGRRRERVLRLRRNDPGLLWMAAGLVQRELVVAG